MPLLRADAIVLKSWDLGEADRLVALYTKEKGRLTAVASRARRMRSRFGGALEPFTWGVAVGFDRNGTGLVRLDGFDVRHGFRAIREDLDRLGQGARMLEAVLRLTAERDASPACFGLLLRALRALEEKVPGRVQLAFALRLLDVLGHRPRLDRCGACGRPVGTTGITFDPSGSVVQCGPCSPVGARVIPGRVLGVLRGLQAASWEARLDADIPPDVGDLASMILDSQLAGIGGVVLKSSRFLAATRTEPEAGGPLRVEGIARPSPEGGRESLPPVGP